MFVGGVGSVGALRRTLRLSAGDFVGVVERGVHRRLAAVPLRGREDRERVLIEGREDGASRRGRRDEHQREQ